MLASDSASRERLELETRVLAAALRQSLELGDTEGSNLAHEQIYILLRACQDMQGLQGMVSGTAGSDLSVVRGRRIPDIQWFSEERSGSTGPESDEPAGPVDEAAAPALTEQSSTFGADEDLATLGEVQAEDFTRKSSDDGNIGGSKGTVRASAAENSQEAEGNHSQEAAEGGERVCVGSGVGDAGRAEFENGIGAGAQNCAAASFYDVLGLSVEANTSTIHLRFLVMVRALLRGIKNRPEPLRGVERKETLKRLQDLWIAHDVLSDRATRSDYDARLLGLRDDGVSEETAVLQPPSHVRIGELLQCSGLLEKTELEVAADMHKAMPEIMFGAFLVKQGFVEEHDLECVLLAQQLIKTNDISLSQFQELMQERVETGVSFSDLVLEHKLVARERVSEAISALSVEELSLVTVSLQLDAPLDAETEAELLAEIRAAELADLNHVQPPHGSDESAQSDPEAQVPFEGAGTAIASSSQAKSRIDRTNAVPVWKDQLDWGDPEVDEKADAAAEPAPEAVPEPLLESAERSADPFETDHAKRDFAVITGKVDALPPHLFDKTAVDEYRSRPAHLPSPAPEPLQPYQSSMDAENNFEEATSAHGAQEHPGAAERVRKRSLIDLMVDFQTHERVQEPPADSQPKEAGESSLSAIFQQQSVTPSSLDDTSGDTEFDGFETEAVSPSDAAQNNAPILNFSVDNESRSLDKDGRNRPSLDEVLFGAGDSVHSAELDEFSVVQPLADASEIVPQLADAASSAHASDSATVTGQIDALPPEEDLFDSLPTEEELAEDVSELSHAVDEVLDLPGPAYGGRSGSAWEENTATDVPAVSNAEIKASDKAQKSKDTWSIISKPASYLASFLMDGGVPKPPKGANPSEPDKKKEKRSNEGSDGSDTDARRGFKRKRGR